MDLIRSILENRSRIEEIASNAKVSKITTLSERPGQNAIVPGPRTLDGAYFPEGGAIPGHRAGY